MADKEVEVPAIDDVSTPPLGEAAVESIIVKDIVPAGAAKARSRQRSYYLDLRIHSPASLGYLAIEGIDTAPALVRLAKVKGLDAIGITDFYSGQFIDRVSAAAKGSDVMIVPGVALRCKIDHCDDVVMIAHFPLDFSSADVDAVLRKLQVPEQAAGNRRYLMTASLRQIIEVVEGAGGFVIPSRMDKTPHRMAVIPTLVEQYGFRAFDVAYAETSRFFRTRWPKMKFTLCSFSNAHALAQVGSRSAKIKLFDFNFDTIKSIFARQLGN